MSASRKEWLLAIETQLNERAQSILDELKELQEGNASNTKSTAGDKHDTERAMVHMEMENLSRRLNNERNLLRSFDALLTIVPLQQVHNGSIVETDRGSYLSGVACGKMKLNEEVIIGISLESPLARGLMNKRPGDTVLINGTAFEIKGLQ